ncbi:hypothetical protein FNV43_RR09635 [Rhamnella rubrinervis]|uniref:Uncharacterized protein n=1 Tax=Rhamnella rubrinervis TaxID=2594499 RepID=A0A8K0HBQ0_9ROSA|nr:hypothetical protein FNV43_RR09635 [Rhamnella rubrinervis]
MGANRVRDIPAVSHARDFQVWECLPEVKNLRQFGTCRHSMIIRYRYRDFNAILAAHESLHLSALDPLYVQSKLDVRLDFFASRFDSALCDFTCRDSIITTHRAFKDCNCPFIVIKKMEDAWSNGRFAHDKFTSLRKKLSARNIIGTQASPIAAKVPPVSLMVLASKKLCSISRQMAGGRGSRTPSSFIRFFVFASQILCLAHSVDKYFVGYHRESYRDYYVIFADEALKDGSPVTWDHSEARDRMKTPFNRLTHSRRGRLHCSLLTRPGSPTMAVFFLFSLDFIHSDAILLTAMVAANCFDNRLASSGRMRAIVIRIARIASITLMKVFCRMVSRYIRKRFHSTKWTLTAALDVLVFAPNFASWIDLFSPQRKISALLIGSEVTLVVPVCPHAYGLQMVRGSRSLNGYSELPSTGSSPRSESAAKPSDIAASTGLASSEMYSILPFRGRRFGSSGSPVVRFNQQLGMPIIEPDELVSPHSLRHSRRYLSSPEVVLFLLRLDTLKCFIPPGRFAFRSAPSSAVIPTDHVSLEWFPLASKCVDFRLLSFAHWKQMLFKRHDAQPIAISHPRNKWSAAAAPCLAIRFSPPGMVEGAAAHPTRGYAFGASLGYYHIEPRDFGRIIWSELTPLMPPICFSPGNIAGGRFFKITLLHPEKCRVFLHSHSMHYVNVMGS